MRVVVLIVVVNIIFHGYAVDLDKVKWPSSKGHSSEHSNPFEKISQLRIKGTKNNERKVDELKNKVDNFKTNLFNAKQEGYPYGMRARNYKGSNGYFKIVKQTPKAALRVDEKPNQSKVSPNTFGRGHQFDQGEGKTKNFVNQDTRLLYSKFNDTPILSVVTPPNLEENTGIKMSCGKWSPMPIKTSSPKSNSPKNVTLQNFQRYLKTINNKNVRKTSNESFVSQFQGKINPIQKGVLIGRKALSQIPTLKLDSVAREQLLDSSRNQSLQEGSEDETASAENPLTTSRPNPIVYIPPLTPRSRQEHIGIVEQLQESADGQLLQRGNDFFEGSSMDLSSGGRKNIIFGSLLEELRLNIFLDYIRKTNLDSMLTIEGKKRDIFTKA